MVIKNMSESNKVKVSISKGSLIFDALIYSILAILSVCMLYPFVNVLAVSISDYSAYLENPLRIWPGKLNFRAFTYVFSSNLIASSYRNTIIIAVVGTIICLILTTLTAYPLSKKGLK